MKIKIKKKTMAYGIEWKLSRAKDGIVIASAYVSDQQDVRARWFWQGVDDIEALSMFAEGITTLVEEAEAYIRQLKYPEAD